MMLFVFWSDMVNRFSVILGSCFMVATFVRCETQAGQRPLNRKTFDLPLVNDTGRVWAASLSHDGKLFAAGWTEGGVSGTNQGALFKGRFGFHVWDLREEKELYRTQLKERIPRSAAFSPDGKLIAWVCDESLQVVELETKRELLRAELPRGEKLFFVGFFSDGQHLLTQSQPMTFDRRMRCGPGDGPAWLFGCTIRVWDFASGKLGRTLYSGKDSSHRSCALSPDGRIAAFAVSPGDPIRVVDLSTCQQIYQLYGKAGGPKGPVFSRDGALLASNYNDSLIAVWDLRNGQKSRDLAAPALEPTFFFSPSGDLLAATKDTAQKWYVTNLDTRNHVSWRADDTCNRAAVSGNGAKLLQFDIRDSKLVWEEFGVQELDLGVSKTRPGKDLQPVELAALWNQLADSNPRLALNATWALADGGDKVSRFLGGRLQAIRVRPERTAKLINDLDDEEFSIREAAHQELKRYNKAVEAPLRSAANKPKSLEVRRRLERLLASIDEAVVSSKETLQVLRAIAVLEYIGTVEAKAVLQRLAAGAPLARQTLEARTALARLGSK
jgi:hypothetical protein